MGPGSDSQQSSQVTVLWSVKHIVALFVVVPSLSDMLEHAACGLAARGGRVNPQLRKGAW